MPRIGGAVSSEAVKNLAAVLSVKPGALSFANDCFKATVMLGAVDIFDIKDFVIRKRGESDEGFIFERDRHAWTPLS